MKFGANTFIWASPSTTAAVREIAPRVRAMGFDILEIAVENPSLLDIPDIKNILAANSLDAIICGVFGPDRDLCSSNPEYVENSKAYMHWMIDAAAEVGSPVVCGPMYSSVGKAHLEDNLARQQEWDKAVAGVGELADYAAPRGVRLAMEPLNRFETDMINVVSQGLEFARQTGRDNVGLHLDTFHMHLEEKDSGEAIRQAGDKIFHFHACENDRGVPGSGQVHWDAIALALKAIDYQGPVVIESFTAEVREIARAVSIWRKIAPDQDTIAFQGLQFLKALLA